MANISPITIARFWSKVSVQPSTKECWEWQGATIRGGYGNFRVPELGRRLNFSAHRIAYKLANGDFPPEGHVVRHKCDNPKCVNPYHLEPGTKADNSKDMLERGRFVMRDQAGEKNGNAKLRRDDVSEIRRRGDLGETNVSIAASFGVTHQLVSKIRKGYFWKSNDAEPS